MIPQCEKTAWMKMLGSFGFLLFLLLPLDPVEGQCVADTIRLASNSTTDNFVGGRLEICLSNSWRAFRYDYFSLQNGHVACQELYRGSHAVSFISSSAAGSTISEFSFECRGTETSLAGCSPTSNSVIGDLVILTCKRASVDGDLRVVGGDMTRGSTSLTGRLQYFSNEIWHNVYYGSGARWTDVEAGVVCRLLGFPFGSPSGSYNSSVDTGDSALLSSFTCTSTSVSFEDCAKEISTTANIGSSPAAVLTCDPGTLEDGTLRVLDSTGTTLTTSRSGIVEMFYQGRWGSLCYSTNIGGNEEEVICNNLGFNYGGIATNASLQLASSRPVWLDTFTCTGPETNPLRCSNVNVGLPQTSTCGSDYLLSISCDEAPVEDTYGAAISPGGITAIIVIGLLTFGFVFPFIATGVMYCNDSGLDCGSCPTPRPRRSHNIRHSPPTTRTTNIESSGLGYEPTDDDSIHEDDNTHKGTLTGEIPPSYRNADKFEKVDQDDKEKPPLYEENGETNLPPYPVSGGDPAYPPV